ncbi:MAG: phosphoribosyltransferase [Magnetovibrionaceae bacterium]
MNKPDAFHPSPFGDTHGFWQDVLPREAYKAPPEPPFRTGYPARLPDGCWLMLPIRRVPASGSGEQLAVASLIGNQASFAVNDILAGFLAEQVRDLSIDAVVGMPTLGLVYAPKVARLLGHETYVPLGYSRKYWYLDDLSEPVSSITTPGKDGRLAKRVYIDPNILPRVANRDVLLVDDAVSSGSTCKAVCRLLERAGARVTGIGLPMVQGVTWIETLGPEKAPLVRAVFSAPRFEGRADGWYPIPGTHFPISGLP